MAQHIVLGVRDFDFVDDKGQRRTGIKVFYLDQPENSDHSRGFLPLVLTAPYDLLEQFPVVPGIYDLEFRQKPDRTGKVVLSLRSAEYLGNFEVPTL